MTDTLIDAEVYAELAEAMGEDFAAELVETFLADAPNMLADLHIAADGGDADGYRRAAHSIKSNAETFGATELANQAREMELSGLPDADPPIADLEAIYAKTATALGALANG